MDGLDLTDILYVFIDPCAVRFLAMKEILYSLKYLILFPFIVFKKLTSMLLAAPSVIARGQL